MMRHFFLVLITAGFVVSLAVPTLAAGETKTVAGELIEMNCYARMGLNAVGEGHAECALKCAQGGSPLGILTADDEIFTIIGEMTEDENMKLVKFVAKNVTATGDVNEGGGPGTRLVGKLTIDITSIDLD